MLMYIEDMHKFKFDNYLMFTQMCDNGYRMVRENEDYSKWNQCVFEDIDYKFYIENNKEDHVEPNKLYRQLYEWLYENYKEIFYYCELSRHLNSFHVIFYFNVTRTKNSRMMCKAIADFVIKRAFAELGYKDIIEYPNVFDECSDSFYQGCFITLNDYKINKECTGLNSDKIITDNYFSIKSIYDNLYKKIHKTTHKTSSANKSDNWEKEYAFDELNKYCGEYLNHHERYRLFKSIVGLCGIDNEEAIKNEWYNCANQLIEGNNHDHKFYCDEPYRNKWIEWIKRNEEFCYVDTEMLSQFGYDIKFINNLKNEENENKIKEKSKGLRKEKVYLS